MVKSVSQNEMSAIYFASTEISKKEVEGRLITICIHPEMGKICIISDVCETGIVCKLRD